MNEAELLAQAHSGDEAAFGQLFARHQRALYRYAVHMCGVETADDIVQDTFLAMLKSNGGFDATRGPVIAYLFGIARHLILKRLGTRYSIVCEPVEAIASRPSADLSALDLLSRQEIVHAVRAAIAALPHAYRETIVLCDLQEIDYLTAATILECPVGTVRSRLHRARALLAERLAVMRPVNQAS